MNVIKRDGVSVVFNGDKIRKAIKKAADSIDIEVNSNIVDILVMTISESKTDLKVEEIQDLVVKYLMDFPEYKNLVLAYERYRTIRTKDRDVNKMFSSIKEIIEVGSNENANKESKKGNVKRDLVAGEVARYTAENKLLPANLVEAHKNKKLHIHDIDFTLSPMTNCCVVNITDMLKNGTVINNAQICSPKSIEVASNVTAQIVAEVAHSQYGRLNCPL